MCSGSELGGAGIIGGIIVGVMFLCWMIAEGISEANAMKHRRQPVARDPDESSGDQ